MILVWMDLGYRVGIRSNSLSSKSQIDMRNMETG